MAKNKNTGGNSIEKITITEEMVETFKDMLLSGNDDVQFAMDILENRDMENVESEKNVNDIHKQIIKNDTLFYKYQDVQIWVVMVDNRVLRVNNRHVFESKGDCMRHTSKHLTNQIGTSDRTDNYRYSDSYYKAIKKIFKGGKELRDYLMKNNLIQFKQLL